MTITKTGLSYVELQFGYGLASVSGIFNDVAGSLDNLIKYSNTSRVADNAFGCT
jgi:hypothetical protein